MKKGIDLSEHNGKIDFNKIKNDGIEFCILRLGWIGNKENHKLDKKFLEYYNLAKSVGLEIGIYVYNYCKYTDTILSGAVWVINKLKEFNINHLEYPIFLDMEDNSILEKQNNTDRLTSICNLFCDFIETQGFKAGVYANKNWFTNYLDINRLIRFKIWLAEYEVIKPTVNFKYDMWQYTSKGKITGLSGKYDLNYCIACDENLNINEIKKGEFEVKQYKNGTTKETVFQDINCTKDIGYLNPHEICECYGIIDNRALVVYKIDKTNNKKTGFVKWLGGVQ